MSSEEVKQRLLAYADAAGVPDEQQIVLVTSGLFLSLPGLTQPLQPPGVVPIDALEQKGDSEDSTQPLVPRGTWE
jgi:hypothetical protein